MNGRSLAIAFALSAFALSAHAQKPQIQWNNQYDFDAVQTFAWQLTPETSLEGRNPFMHSLIKNTIEAELATSGLTQVDANPDVYVNCHASTNTEVQLRSDSYGYSMGGYGMGGWGYYGMAAGPVSTTTRVVEYQKGTLVVDIWDAEMKRARVARRGDGHVAGQSAESREVGRQGDRQDGGPRAQALAKGARPARGRARRGLSRCGGRSGLRSSRRPRQVLRPAAAPETSKTRRNLLPRPRPPRGRITRTSSTRSAASRFGSPTVWPKRLRRRAPQRRIVTRYFGNEVTGDLNGDGRDDVAFLLTQETGGSGTFFYVVAALDLPGGLVGTEGLFLGDRIAPQTTELRPDGVVVVNYADHALEREPLEPAVGRQKHAGEAKSHDPTARRVVQDFEGDADPASMELGMKTWVWVRAVDGANEIVPRQADAFTLTFEGGTFSATTDCNRVRGGYTTQDRELTSPKRWPRRGCSAPIRRSRSSPGCSEDSELHLHVARRLVLQLADDGGSQRSADRGRHPAPPPPPTSPPAPPPPPLPRPDRRRIPGSGAVDFH